LKDQKIIFVVDDDPFILKLVKSRLEQKNYSVRTFLYGEDCLKEMDLNPDLIILDYLFHNNENPDVLDGKEIFRKLNEAYSDIPVIMLSGQEDGDVVLELARMGIKDYVIKDQTFIDSLLAVVEEYVETTD